jgi:Leucine-rich repeat (LRR) protein
VLRAVKFCFKEKLKRRVDMKKYILLSLSLIIVGSITAQIKRLPSRFLLPVFANRGRYSKRKNITRGKSPISLKTLVNKNKVPKIVNGVLDLRRQGLTSLAGLNNVDSVQSARVIDLRHNDIVNVYPGAFPSKVMVVNLNYNSIKTLKKGAFSNLGQLHSVLLQFNQITDVESGAFNNLPNLRLVSLRNNPGFTEAQKERIAADIKKAAPQCEVRF